jgi:hypothetical protein
MQPIVSKATSAAFKPKLRRFLKALKPFVQMRPSPRPGVASGLYKLLKIQGF